MGRRLVYGDSEFPQARIDSGGDVLERYIYGTQAHVPDVIVRRDGQRIRLVLDSAASVRAAVDADTGAVLQRLSYDAYGRVTQDTNPGLQPFGFKGSLSDPVAEGANLVWMGVRAYQPRLGRFVTPDPAGLAAGWNQHDAFGGDPINLIDADGRFAQAAAAGAIGFGPAAVVVAVVVAVAVTAYAIYRLIDACVDWASDDDDWKGTERNPDGSPGPAARGVAEGHAGSVHAGDFEGQDVDDLAETAQEAIESGKQLVLDRGRTAYQTESGTTVIVDPEKEGTMFKPNDPDAYWESLAERR